MDPDRQERETMTNAIEASGLVKRFGKTTALAGVDLVAQQGTVLGVLGPNGAGKTTAVRILATLLRPDGGQARVCGYDVGRQPHQVRQLIGLTGQYASVDEGLSGVNNLIMIGRLLGQSRRNARARANELLDRFDLTEAAGRPAKTYSGGMRRRLDLAASLVGRPRVLYLDEPTTGLDPRSRSDVWDIVRTLVADGVTVLLTTRTPDELKDKSGGQVLEVEPADRNMLEVAAAVLANRTGAVPDTNADSGLVRVPVADAAVLPAIIRELDEARVELAEFSLRKASLDEVFLALTGREPADPEND